MSEQIVQHIGLLLNGNRKSARSLADSEPSINKSYMLTDALYKNGGKFFIDLAVHRSQLLSISTNETQSQLEILSAHIFTKHNLQGRSISERISILREALEQLRDPIILERLNTNGIKVTFGGNGEVLDQIGDLGNGFELRQLMKEVTSSTKNNNKYHIHLLVGWDEELYKKEEVVKAEIADALHIPINIARRSITGLFCSDETIEIKSELLHRKNEILELISSNPLIKSLIDNIRSKYTPYLTSSADLPLMDIAIRPGADNIDLRNQENPVFHGSGFPLDPVETRLIPLKNGLQHYSVEYYSQLIDDALESKKSGKKGGSNIIRDIIMPQLIIMRNVSKLLEKHNFRIVDDDANDTGDWPQRCVIHGELKKSALERYMFLAAYICNIEVNSLDINIIRAAKDKLEDMANGIAKYEGIVIPTDQVLDYSGYNYDTLKKIKDFLTDHTPVDEAGLVNIAGKDQLLHLKRLIEEWKAEISTPNNPELRELTIKEYNGIIEGMVRERRPNGYQTINSFLGLDDQNNELSKEDDDGAYKSIGAAMLIYTFAADLDKQGLLGTIDFEKLKKLGREVSRLGRLLNDYATNKQELAEGTGKINAIQILMAQFGLEEEEAKFKLLNYIEITKEKCEELLKGFTDNPLLKIAAERAIYFAYELYTKSNFQEANKDTIANIVNNGEKHTVDPNILKLVA